MGFRHRVAGIVLVTLNPHVSVEVYVVIRLSDQVLSTRLVVGTFPDPALSPRNYIMFRS